MNKGVFPHRRRTINQERIELLLKNYSNSIIGMTLQMLGVPNAPEELKINKEIFKLSQILTMENVFAFMISKYNIFPQVIQGDSKWVKFKPTPSTGLNSIMYYIDSQQFQKQRQSIALELKKAFQKKKKYFVGFEIYHFNEQFELPKTVSISKISLKQLLEDTNERDVESRAKKIYRGLTFFFSARYNLVNATKKNRKTMKFTTNYTFENGDQNLSLFTLFSNIPKIQVNFLNPEQRKRVPSRMNKNNNNKTRTRARTRKRYKLIYPNKAMVKTANHKFDKSYRQNYQKKKQSKIEKTFSMIFREEQAKTELGLVTPSTAEKIKNYTETEREMVEFLTLLKYYQLENY